MTEAEKALVDYVLNDGWSEPELAQLARVVRAERVPLGAKRAWMDLWKKHDKACREFRENVGALGLPEGVDISDWRVEARKELENE